MTDEKIKKLRILPIYDSGTQRRVLVSLLLSLHFLGGDGLDTQIILWVNPEQG